MWEKKRWEGGSRLRKVRDGWEADGVRTGQEMRQEADVRVGQ